MTEDIHTRGELDRLYTIPLSKAWIAPKHRRSKRVINIIREFAEKHMRSSQTVISPELNELVWDRGIQNPPRKIMVRMTKDRDGVVTISLPTSRE